MVYILAPQIMPVLMDQNKNTRSMGSFTAVRNRTMDNAPTIPRDITILDWMVNITAAVITARAISARLKLRL